MWQYRKDDMFLLLLVAFIIAGVFWDKANSQGVYDNKNHEHTNDTIPCVMLVSDTTYNKLLGADLETGKIYYGGDLKWRYGFYFITPMLQLVYLDHEKDLIPKSTIIWVSKDRR